MFVLFYECADSIMNLNLLCLLICVIVSQLIKTSPYTYKKEKKIFLIYKKILMGSVAKSYMRKDVLIYEGMRKYLTTYEVAVIHI